MNSCLNVPVVSYYHHHLNINLGFGGTFVVCIQKRLRMSSTTEVHQVWLSRCSHIPHMCLGMEVPIKMNGFQKGRLRALFRAKDHKVKVCLWFWSSWKFLVPFLNHIYCFWCWLLSTLILFGLIWVWSSQKSFKNQGLKNCWITLRILISRYVQRMIWSRSHAFILSSKKKRN